MALLKFTQGPNTAAFGVAVAGTQTDGATVTCSNSTGASATYKLSRVPPGSALTAGSTLGTATTATFDWDVAGTYQVECYVGGLLTDRRDFVIPNARGRFVPSAGSTDQTFNLLGSADGWTAAVNASLDAAPDVGVSTQVLRADGSAGNVPAVALPAPAAGSKGGVSLPGSATGLFYRDDGSFAAAGGGLLAPALYSARPAAGTAGRRFTPTDGVVEFVDDGAAWHPIVGGGRYGTQVPAVAGWTTIGVDASTGFFTDVGGCVYLYSVAYARTAHNVKIAYRAWPASKRVTAHFRIVHPPYSDATHLSYQAGIVLRNSAGNLIQMIGFAQLNDLARFQINDYSAPNTPVATSVDLPMPGLGFSDLWLRVDEIGGAFRSTFISTDGVNWQLIDARSVTDYVTTNQAGIYVEAYSGGTAGILLDSWDET